jgi:peptidoglycan/xylan/chitin deacetylase (PgdA/CDA1 family)
MVIALHRVTEAALPANEPLLNDFIEITDKKLEQTILDLQKMNVQFVSLDALRKCFKENKKPKRPVVHFSFDDGYLDNFSIAFPIFKKYNIPFSIFVSSDFINNDQPFLWWYIIEEIIKNEQTISFSKYNFSITQLDYQTKSKHKIFEEWSFLILEYMDNDKIYFEDKLREYSKDILGFSIPKTLHWNDLNTMLASGLCELGVHTKSHSRFKYLSADQKIEEILSCKEAIRLHTSVVAKYFSYPYGAKDDLGNLDEVKKMLLESGMDLALTTIPSELNQTNHPLLIPRLFINNSVTTYTLKSRLNGSYQRSIAKEV